MLRNGLLAPLLATAPRVLLAEGDLLSARALRHRLERDGVRPVAVTDGPDALARLREPAPNAPLRAALLDAGLAGVDGLDVLRRIRAGEAGPPDLPVAILCRPGNDAAVARAYDLDADVVLIRPLSLVPVSAAASRLIRRSAP